MIFDKKHIRFWTKLLFGIVVLSFLYWKIREISGEGYVRNVEFNHEYTVVLLAIVFVLMVANWSLEALKWKCLMSELKSISFFAALKGVLAGVSTGIITPNRLGNFIGRVVILEKEHRLKATLLTLLANLAQFVPTIFFGCLGLLFIGANFFAYSQIILFAVALLLLVLALSVYVNPQLINRRPFNRWLSEQMIKAVFFIQETKLPLKISVLGLSAVRYFTFVTQYVLLLLLFESDVEVFQLYAGVTVVYLLMTLIPGFFFGKLFVREAAGLLVLGEMGVPDHIVLITGFILWFVNIALPSLIGMTFLIRKK